MPDVDDNVKADDDVTSHTPLHAYKEGREGDINADAGKLTSNDAKQLQADQLEDEDEELRAPEKK